MTKEKIAFAKRADKFIVHYGDNASKEFANYPEAANFYNEHLSDDYVEICAISGIVGLTLAYHKK